MRGARAEKVKVLKNTLDTPSIIFEAHLATFSLHPSQGMFRLRFHFVPFAGTF